MARTKRFVLAARWQRLAVTLAVIAGGTSFPLLDPFVPGVQAATVGSGVCAQTVDSTVGVSMSASGNTCTMTFSAVGAMRTWTVPVGGLTNVSFTIKGGKGGGTDGTNGAAFTGTISSLPAGSVHVYVGSAGVSSGSSWVLGGSMGGYAGNNGSGSGGGATDIRVGGSTSADRKIVAGGGGGGTNVGSNPYPGTDANGSTQGSPGYDTTGCVRGAGNAAAGGNGAPSDCRQGGGGGGGYAGGGAGGTGTDGGDNSGGVGGRGSSYIAAGFAVAADSSLWNGTGANSGSGVNLVPYSSSLYSNTSNGSLVLTFTAVTPVNSVAPTISPDYPVVGNTMTRTQGTWTTPIGALTYTGQWVRRDSVTFAETDIPGATNPTYVVTADDIGYRLRYRETADNGTASATSMSTATAVVVGQPAFTTNSPSTTTPISQVFSYTFEASGGSITYSLVNSTLPNTITLSGGTLSGTPTVAGSYTYTVRATNSAGTADTTHELHIGRSASLSVSSTTQVSGTAFTITPIVTLATGATPGASVSVTASIHASAGGTPTLGGTLTQATDAAGVAAFAGLTLTGLAGSYTIRFSASGWPAADLTVTLGAGTATTLVITTEPVGGVLPGAMLGTVPEVRVVDSSGNTVTSSSATVVATIASGSVNATLTGGSVSASAGVATFTGMAVNNAGGNFTLLFSSSGLTSVTSSQFTINRATQTITFTYGGGNKTYSSPDFPISASTDSSLVVTFSSSTPSVCGVSGDGTANAGSTSAVVSIDGVGTCTIDADQPGDDFYAAATRRSITFAVSQGSQSTLSIASPASFPFGATPTLTTTGGSGTGVVNFALVGGVGSAQCTVDQTTGAMTFGAAGTCTVLSTKAADTNFTQQTSSNHVITVTPAAQTLAFTSSVPNQALPGDTYVVTATSSSGLPPFLSILQGLGSVCSISGSASGSTITFNASGTCEVMASNSGNGNYLPPVVEPTQRITVGSFNQSITFLPIANREFGDPNFPLSASASSGLSVTYTNVTPSVCSLVGGSVAILTVGRCTITASQAGNGQWATASSITRSFDISAVVPGSPTVSSVSGQSAAVSVSFAGPSFAGGSPVLGYRVVATPTNGGPAVSTNDCPSSPCVIDGLTNGTEYEITVAAINAVGTGLVSVVSPPVTPATSAMAVRNGVGVPGNETLTLSWTAPDEFGGGTFVRYELRLRVAGSAWPASSTHDVLVAASGSHTFTGLDNGVAYEVQIVTITTANQSVIVGNTTVISSVPRTVPGAPRSLIVVDTAAGEITLSWAAPLSDGGAAITGYVVGVGSGACGAVTIDPNTGTASCVVANLLSQATYPISIQALNEAGSGASHTGSHTVATYQAPQAPNAPFIPPTPGGADPDDPPAVPPPGGPGAPPLPGTDDDDDGLPEAWRPVVDPNNVPGRPCSGCIQLFPAPGDNGSPGTGGSGGSEGNGGSDGGTSRPGVTSTPPGSKPGTITVTTGGGTIIVIGGNDPGGKPATTTSPNGGLVVEPPGNVPIVLSGLKPGSTVTVWLADNLSTTGVVGPDGTVVLSAPIPPGLAPGIYTGRVDMTDADGVARSLLFGFEWRGSQGTLPVTGSGSLDLLVIVMWLFVAGCLVRAVSRRRFGGGYPLSGETFRPMR